MLSLCVFMLTVFASCINREFDSNDEFKHSKSIALNADNDRLLSRIFIINENKSYLWFDLNNEVANFSKPQFTLPIIEGGKIVFAIFPCVDCFMNTRLRRMNSHLRMCPNNSFRWATTNFR